MPFVCVPSTTMRALPGIHLVQYIVVSRLLQTSSRMFGSPSFAIMAVFESQAAKDCDCLLTLHRDVVGLNRCGGAALQILLSQMQGSHNPILTRWRRRVHGSGRAG